MIGMRTNVKDLPIEKMSEIMPEDLAE